MQNVIQWSGSFLSRKLIENYKKDSQKSMFSRNVRKPIFLLWQNFATWHPKEKDLILVLKDFFLKKMAQSCHISRKIKG